MKPVPRKSNGKDKVRDINTIIALQLIGRSNYNYVLSAVIGRTVSLICSVAR